MFIPVGTDAPIYHLPIATVLLAIANVATHVALGQIAPDVWGLSDLKLDWALWLGEGLHPVQWFTYAFLHRGWIDLIANVIFLGAFGIIVEGKLGWWRFLLLYLAIAAGAAGIEQAALLRGGLTAQPRARLEANLREQKAMDDEEIDLFLDSYEGGYPAHTVALGADGAVFGLVAICMIWAPRNEVNVFWVVWRIGGITGVPLLTFALLYVGFEAFALAVQTSVLGLRFAVSGALMNVIGAAVGAGAGVLWLKRGWVDCENWDLFAVLGGTHGNQDEFDLRRTEYQRELTVPTQTASGPTGEQAGEDLSRDADPPRPGRAGKKAPRRPADPLTRLRKHLDAGDGISALGEWETLVGGRPRFVPPEPVLFALAEAVDKANFAEEAGELFDLYLTHYADPHAASSSPAGATAGATAGAEPFADHAAHLAIVRLRAARRLLERPGQRRRAATLLDEVDPAALPPKCRKMWEKLRAMAAG